MLAGIMQFLLGVFKAGVVGDYVPNSVIKGMLAAIGIILILKQLPHLIGYDKDYGGDETFWQTDKENTFTEIINSLGFLTIGAAVIGMVSIGILILWETKFLKSKKFLIAVFELFDKDFPYSKPGYLTEPLLSGVPQLS